MQTQKCHLAAVTRLQACVSRCGSRHIEVKDVLVALPHQRRLLDV
jgi:hypothetical protein